MTPEQLQRIIEAAIMVAGNPLTPADLQKLFDEKEQPDVKQIRELLQNIQQRYNDSGSGIELCEVASGFQFQARVELSPWLTRLWEERAPRYSRAFLETLALIAYRQPITRAEIEEIRGVAVSSQIIKTLQDREWIRVIGHRDTPGKPALYATTKTFLDHFNLKTLEQLPSLADLIDLESQEEKLQVQLDLGVNEAQEDSKDAENNDPELSQALEDKDSDNNDSKLNQNHEDFEDLEAEDEDVEALDLEARDTETPDLEIQEIEAQEFEAEEIEVSHTETQNIEESDADEMDSDKIKNSSRETTEVE